jgi:hypothetical protein
VSSGSEFERDGLIDELWALVDAADAPVYMRQRAVMVGLSLAGWEVRAIASHLGPSERTISFWLERFRELGVDGIRAVF